MIPIHELLNDIKWNKNRDPDAYTLGYYDRVKDTLIEIPFTAIEEVDEGFMIITKDAEKVHIPLHRIKQVKEHDTIIWQR